MAVNSVLSAVLYLPITYWLFRDAADRSAASTYTAGGIYLASLVGIWC